MGHPEKPTERQTDRFREDAARVLQASDRVERPRAMMLVDLRMKRFGMF